MNKALFLIVCVLVGITAGAAVHFRDRFLPRPQATSSAPSRAAPVVATPSARRAEGRASGERTSSSAGVAGEARDAPRAARSTPMHSYHDGIMRVAPSVVSLYASLEDTSAATPPGATPTRRLLSQGSGVVIDPDGIVLTNLHLLEGADAINVVLADGTLHTGRLIGSDRETDLAVVRIESSGIPSSGLAAVPLDDAPPLRVGDVVLAIGNPFGVGQTVTQGIVSATRRRVAGGSAWQDFVQIDAAINPGNSGGALINPDGQLVGVTTAVFRGGTAAGGGDGGGAEGIGFAIPAELLSRVVPEIIADGRVVRGWLGIGADDLPMFPALHRRFERGAVITSVLSDSPAARGGLARGDVVTHVDGHPVADATDLLLLVSSLGPGTAIRLRVEREGGSLELLVNLGERPPIDAATPR